MQPAGVSKSLTRSGGAVQKAVDHPARFTDGDDAGLRRRFPFGAPKPARGRTDSENLSPDLK